MTDHRHTDNGDSKPIAESHAEAREIVDQHRDLFEKIAASDVTIAPRVQRLLNTHE